MSATSADGASAIGQRASTTSMLAIPWVAMPFRSTPSMPGDGSMAITRPA